MKKIIILLLVGLGGGIFFLTKGFLFLKIVTVIFGILAGFLALFVKRIPARECWVIDRLGQLIEKKPGYRIIIPYFGIDKIVKKIPTVQYPIVLFEDLKTEGKEVRIDLKSGGEVILHDPRIWILVENPVETVRISLDFETQLREMVENRITGALNMVNHEEVMELRQPKQEQKETIKNKLDEIIQGSQSIQRFLRDLEITYKGFTLDDFDFDNDTKQQRRERILSEMEKEIRKNRGESFLEETKGYPQGVSPDVAAMLLKGQSPIVVKFEGGGGFNLTEAALQWEIGKKLAGESQRRKTESPKKWTPPTPEEHRRAMEEIREKIKKEEEIKKKKEKKQ